MATDHNIACRSRFSGHWAAIDFSNPSAGRFIHGAALLAVWLWQDYSAKPVANACLLLEKDGRLSPGAVESLQQSRNNRVLDLQQ